MLTSISKNSFLISGTIHSHCHSHSHLILDPGSAYYDDVGGVLALSEVIIKCISRIHGQMAVSVAVDCALRLRTFAQKFLT